MANHPYNQHREQQVAHRRVATILNEAPAGANKHGSGHAFSKITSKSAAVRDDEIAGRSSPKRFARGGKVKHSDEAEDRKLITKMMKEHERKEGESYARGGRTKGNTTNIIIASQPKETPTPPIPMVPPGPLPGGPPMGPPPGGPPPGMPMRASGGRVSGTSTKGNLGSWANRAAKNSYAKGGRITAGAETGVGRLQKARGKK